jgi:putative transposase
MSGNRSRAIVTSDGRASPARDSSNSGTQEPSRTSDDRLETEDIDAPAWRIALCQVADLKSLLKNGELSEELARMLANRWGTSVRTVWRRVRAFRREGSVRAVLNRRRGSSPGVGRMLPEVEAVISDSARNWWKATENATIAEVYPTVIRDCVARGLSRPSRATVARRLAVLRRDAANFAPDVAAKLRDRTRLVKSSYTVEHALAVVQVDHTVADVFIVDPVSRCCIGRPTLTVAIDVSTRCVLGMCLALEAPSSLLVALCLENAVGPKEAWLKGLGAHVEWPVFGTPHALHVDNGREFHSAAFRRGCDLNGIEIIYRPPGTPRYGGHVERLIGTLMRRVRLLPGNSFSDLLGARPGRAESRATLTLSELGGFLVQDIERYHRHTHRALRQSPLAAWERHWAREQTEPRMPCDLVRFRLDFLPLQRRVVGREGIELFGLKYSCEELAPEVHLGARRVVRFDPRDVSRVYLERPRAQPLLVPLRDRSLPAMSLWELRAVRKASPEAIERADSEGIRVALEQIGEGTVTPSKMRSRRRAARSATWREVQALASLPVADTTLQTTLASDEIGSLPWEVLE